MSCNAKFILGIDPGISGGVALLDEKGAVLEAFATPTVPYGDKKQVDCTAIVDRLRPHLLIEAPEVFLEKVGAFRGQGVTSMFSFGKSFGQVIGMCQALEWNIHFVRPQQWQKVIKASAPLLLWSDKWEKQNSIMFCHHVHSETSLLATSRSTKSHDGMADAICIAHYGFLELFNRDGM